MSAVLPPLSGCALLTTIRAHFSTSSSSLPRLSSKDSLCSRASLLLFDKPTPTPDTDSCYKDMKQGSMTSAKDACEQRLRVHSGYFRPSACRKYFQYLL